METELKLSLNDADLPALRAHPLCREQEALPAELPHATDPPP